MNSLFADIAEWTEERARLSEAEENGVADSDDWARSDDLAVSSADISSDHVEPLTDAMIRSMRAEAANTGDVDQVKSCDAALRGGFLDSFSRAQCAAAINRSRGVNNKPFVRVIP